MKIKIVKTDLPERKKFIGKVFDAKKDVLPNDSVWYSVELGGEDIGIWYWKEDEVEIIEEESHAQKEDN